MLASVRISDTVTLRLLEQEDAERVTAAYTRNRAHLAQWEPARPEAFFTTAWHEDDIAKNLGVFQAGASVPLVLATGDTVTSDSTA